jgi:hypothetical protein
LPYVDDEDPATGDYLLMLGSPVASMTWPRRIFPGGHQCMVRTSINLHKKLWPIFYIFASSSSPICLLINMQKKLFLVFMHWVAMMYFYDNYFFMMFLSNFWTKPLDE